MTTIPPQLGPTARVQSYTEQFARFLSEEVAPLEKELAQQGVGTPSQPKLDERGRMHPVVWEARREVQRRAGRLRLYAPNLSQAYGGRGLTRLEMHHVEEFVYRQSGLGLGLAALAWTEGPYPSTEYMSPALRQRYLEPLMRGEMTLAFANTELRGGSDVLGMETHARRDGSDWIINGRKGWITNAHYCDVVQVVCVTDPGARTRSLSMFLVDAKTPGFRHGADLPTMLDDGLTGEIEFDQVRVPAENLIGEEGDGFALAMMSINQRRVCRGGMCAGWGEWLIERALQYTQARQSAGRPLASYQAVEHMVARMDLDVHQMRCTSLATQARLDELEAFSSLQLHPEVPRLVSLLKAGHDEAFLRVCDNAIQVRGAAGLRRDSPEEKLFRIARNLRIPAGAVEIQLNAIARGLYRNVAAA